jgi:hypothetical protein
MTGRLRALRSDAMTRGNKVYPMMHTDWKKELARELATCSSGNQERRTYMFPPRSLICKVTTASPIQTMVNTPENTRLDCSSDALMDKNMLRRRQNINGPLKVQTPISATLLLNRFTHLLPGEVLTRDPNPATLRSFHPATQLPHPATAQPDSATHLRNP